MNNHTLAFLLVFGIGALVGSFVPHDKQIPKFNLFHANPTKKYLGLEIQETNMDLDTYCPSYWTNESPTKEDLSLWQKTIRLRYSYDKVTGRTNDTCAMGVSYFSGKINPNSKFLISIYASDSNTSICYGQDYFTYEELKKLSRCSTDSDRYWIGESAIKFIEEGK